MQLDRVASLKTIGIFVVPVLFFQSCATFRSNIDMSCVHKFATEYPDPQESRFILPWRAGESFKLTQGNCTFESHSLSEKQHMSFDFRMPIGTPIVAVDDGRVIIVIKHFKDGIDDGFDEANLVGIEHDGGLLSWYMHLTFDGSLVQVDDQVSKGDIIAYSGNTGRSAYPHLHFFVQQLTEECHDAESRTADLGLCPQVPVSFLNVSPSQAVLDEWVTYTAM